MVNGIGVAEGNLDIVVGLPNGMSIDGPQPRAGTGLEGLLGNKDSILLDCLHKTVYVNDNGKPREVHLTPTEFNLLEYLMSNAGRAIPYDEISREVLR